MKKLIITLIVLILLIGSPIIWFKIQNAAHKGEIEIFEGASMKQVAEILEEKNIIKNSDVFYYYVRLKTMYLDKRGIQEKNWNPNIVKPGKFTINNGNFDSIVHQLSSGEGFHVDTKRVTIPEGKTISDMADIFEKAGLFSKDVFLKTVNDKATYSTLKNTYPWLPAIKPGTKYLLEGYLYPNTYEFPINTTPREVIDMMLKETDALYKKYESLLKTSQLRVSKNESSYLTFAKVITLASVVEGESKAEADRAKVAQVFLNRITAKAKLESDMTAAYANGEHKVFMYTKDIKVKSPYNTYYVKGLPLGPINSPSESAILGVLKPAGKNFKMYYFYARPNGQTFYARTWREHERNRLKYEKEWKALEKK